MALRGSEEVSSPTSLDAFYPNFEDRRRRWASPIFSNEFKRDEVAQINERGYPVAEVSERLGVAKLLKAVVQEEQPGLVILEKQAIDDDSNQTGQMLAAWIGRPQGTFASKIEKQDETVVVTCEIDGGLETVRLSLPAIVTTDLRLNEPRYASLPNIMKAKAKPLAIKTLGELGVDISPRLKTLRVTSFSAPRQRCFRSAFA